MHTWRSLSWATAWVLAAVQGLQSNEIRAGIPFTSAWTVGAPEGGHSPPTHLLSHIRGAWLPNHFEPFGIYCRLSAPSGIF
jgi:hypothetical protein